MAPRSSAPSRKRCLFSFPSCVSSFLFQSLRFLLVLLPNPSVTPSRNRVPRFAFAPSRSCISRSRPLRRSHIVSDIDVPLYHRAT